MEGDWGAFAEAFETCQQNATSRARIGKTWPLFELLKDKNQEHIEVIHDWLDPVVEKAVGDRRSAEKAGVQSSIAEKTFLQHLADSTDSKSTNALRRLANLQRLRRSCSDSRPTLEYASGVQGYGKHSPFCTAHETNNRVDSLHLDVHHIPHGDVPGGRQETAHRGPGALWSNPVGIV